MLSLQMLCLKNILSTLWDMNEWTVVVLQTCPGRCTEFKECVQCLVYKTGPLTEEECSANCTFVPTLVENVEGTTLSAQTINFQTMQKTKKNQTIKFYTNLEIVQARREKCNPY